MRIQHNIMAMNAYRNYNTNTSALSKNLEKLSSGYRINRAGDDAAGLAISEKMRAQITGLNAAQKNVKDGISLVKTAEGAMQEIQDMLNRMDYLATQSANGTYDNEVDRKNLQKEVDALKSEINRIADSANFNGINLLDGSMDADKVTTTTADSAISNITTDSYSPKGASDAFEASYITNRPEASTTQTNASFVVSLDDISFSNATANDTFTLKVGGTDITYKFAGTLPTDAEELAAKIAASGHAHSNAITDAATGDAAANKNTTADFTDDADWKDTTKSGAYVEIEGHIWKMEACDSAGAAAGTKSSIKFTQVDFSTDGKAVTPDYGVGYTFEDKSNPGGTAAADKEFGVTGTINWQNQLTTKGTAVGSSHQAQVEVAIDFNKLKDGDTLNVGNKTYIFAVGKDSIYAKDASGNAIANGTANADGQIVVNLTSIFKQESDLADENKQADAMVSITNAMKPVAHNGSTDKAPWTAGNKGVDGGIGTLTFQSQSGYVGDATGAADAEKAYIAGDQKYGVCDMTTEASVMKQFFSGRQEAGAKTSFDVDVTKIQVGDTFTIDGKNFEFTDGTEASSKNNVAVDLSSLGVSGGILSSQTADVMTALQTAVQNTFNTGSSPKYTVTIDENKLTLTSKDDANTVSTYENRVNAAIDLPTITTNGKALTLQIGDTADTFNQLSVSIGDMHTAALGIANLDISNIEGAQAAIDTIKNAINQVSSVRGDLGATQNRLEHTANNLSVMAENIQDAESTIRDTDVAEEMMAYTKNNILIQSAQAMLAQANAVPQGVLQLLG